MNPPKIQSNSLAIIGIYLSIVTSIAVAASYVGKLEGRLSTLEDVKSYKVADEEKQRVLIEIGREGKEQQDAIIASIENRIDALQKIIESKNLEIQQIEAKADAKILQLKKETESNKKNSDQISLEIEKKRKLLESLKAASIVYSEQVYNSENSENKIPKTQEAENIITPKNDTPSTGDDYFVLQIAAHKERSVPDRIVEELKREGYDAQVESKNGLWIVICCERYRTTEDAIKAKKALMESFPNGRNVKAAFPRKYSSN